MASDTLKGGHQTSQTSQNENCWAESAFGFRIWADMAIMRIAGQTAALGGEPPGCARTRRTAVARLQEPPFFFPRGNERVEAVGAAAIGATAAREMNELILALNVAGVRYLLMGGQAMRLAGMPRYSRDWDFFKPAGVSSHY